MDVLSHLHRESSPAMKIKPPANQSCSRGAGLDVGHAGSVATSLPSYIQWITQKLKVLTQFPVCMSLGDSSPLKAAVHTSERVSRTYQRFTDALIYIVYIH